MSNIYDFSACKIPSLTFMVFYMHFTVFHILSC